MPAQKIFEELFTNIVLIGKEHKDVGDYKLIHKALGELHSTLKMFLPYRDNRRIAIFGSGRVSDSHCNYKLALDLAQGLAR